MNFTDFLKEHVRGLATRYIYEGGLNLPAEFDGIDRDRLITLIVDEATPILRGLEETALHAGINRVCSMIRFAKNG